MQMYVQKKWVNLYSLLLNWTRLNSHMHAYYHLLPIFIKLEICSHLSLKFQELLQCLEFIILKHDLAILDDSEQSINEIWLFEYFFVVGTLHIISFFSAKNNP